MRAHPLEQSRTILGSGGGRLNAGCERYQPLVETRSLTADITTMSREKHGGDGAGSGVGGEDKNWCEFWQKLLERERAGNGGGSDKENEHGQRMDE